MEKVRKNGIAVIKIEKEDRKASPAVSVITENNAEFSLFLCPLNNGNIQEIKFKTPDRCEGRTTEISPVFLDMLTETQRGLFRKNTVIGTVFLTDGEPDGCLVPLDKAVTDSDNESYFGIDRRCLAARLSGTRISFEKALFIEISESRREAFFCRGEQVVSCFPITVQKENTSPVDIVISVISKTSEILDFFEDFAPDALFVSITSPTEKDIKRISNAFEKKNTTLFFQTVDNRELALFAAKILANKRQKSI